MKFRQDDLAGRLQKQTSYNQKQKIAVPVQREFGYDNFGNLNRLSDGLEETRYVYDLLNRLKKAEGNIPETFAFDPAGNLLQSGDTDSSNNSSVKGNRLFMQGDRKFTYDARGNLIQENRGKDGKLVTTFEYNLNNQLIKTTKDGQTTTYTYDPLGRRISKTDAFGTTRYLWAGDQMVQEQRNNLKKTYIFEPENFKPVAQITDGKTYHYHLDHLGTPRELTDDQGKVVWKVRYKTYGNVAVKEVEEVENNLRFQGQYFDEETGLHYNRFRYYNPNTGQFITQDPIGLLGGVNNYQYAPNPVGWVDPFGLSCKEEQPDRPKVSEDGRRIHYFTKDDIKVKKMYDGEEYFFYVEDQGEMLELAYTTVKTEQSSLEFYINNQFNDGVLMKAQGFGITNEILKRSIQIFADDHGAPPEFLNGTIVKKNLSNFQKEYAKLKAASPQVSDDEAAVQAIKDISFGRERMKLGYSDIKVDASGKTNVIVDGQELNDVPTRVKITAKRSDGGQMIPKRELLDMLWGVVNEDPAAIALRTDAAKQKDKYWRSDEWIYIKDIEVSLKSINRAIMEKSVSLPVSIQDLIFSGLGEDQFSENKWVLQKINDCRENMKVISNPD